MKFILILGFFLIMSISIDLNGQELSMFQGPLTMEYYEDDIQISRKEFTSLIMNNPETQPLWLRHRKNVTAGWISLGAMTGCLIWQYNRAENGQSQVVPAVGVVASAIAVVAFSAISFNYQKRAILRYNKQFDKGSFNLGMTQNGVGWVMTF